MTGVYFQAAIQQVFVAPPFANRRAVERPDDVPRARRRNTALARDGLVLPHGIFPGQAEIRQNAGDLFVTEYGVGGAGRVVRFSRDGPAGAFSPNTYVDLGALLSEPERCGLPADLVNPWSLTFAAGGDALYVATDPNHRAVLHLDGAGNFVKTLERRGEAPNFVLCA